MDHELMTATTFANNFTGQKWNRMAKEKKHKYICNETLCKQQVQN